MLKVIELLIDESLSGETRVEEVALVEFPAIEVDAIYFSKQRFFRAPQYVADKACQAIRENEKRGNPAGTQVGKIRAQQLCKREEISLDTIKRMKSFLERASTYDTGNWDDNGTIAMGLWGGGEALVWIDKILRQQEGFDYDTTGLPTYDQYPTGDTKNNMLIEPVLFVKVKPGESESDYVSRCMGSQDMISEFPDEEQRAAVCYSTYERKDEFDCGCMEKEEFIEPNPCQSGYVAYGTKIKDGKEVPNCIPLENSKQEFDLLGYIDGVPYFSTPEEAETYGEETYGCEGHHIHTDEEGNEVYMSCATHEELPDDGVELEELLSQGWRIESWSPVQKQEVYNEQFRRQVSNMTKEQFYQIVTKPNEFSPALDTEYRKVRFIYLTGMGLGGNVIDTSREFCDRMLGGRQFVFRYEDIMRLNEQITSEDGDRKIIPRPIGTQPDIFTWKGGANCRHYWAELVFMTDNPTVDVYNERITNDATRERNKAAIETPVDGQSGQVNPKASTVRGTRSGA